IRPDHGEWPDLSNARPRGGAPRDAPGATSPKSPAASPRQPAPYRLLALVHRPHSSRHRKPGRLSAAPVTRLRPGPSIGLRSPAPRWPLSGHFGRFCPLLAAPRSQIPCPPTAILSALVRSCPRLSGGGRLPTGYVLARRSSTPLRTSHRDSLARRASLGPV